VDALPRAARCKYVDAGPQMQAKTKLIQVLAAGARVRKRSPAARADLAGALAHASVARD